MNNARFFAKNALVPCPYLSKFALVEGIGHTAPYAPHAHFCDIYGVRSQSRISTIASKTYFRAGQSTDILLASSNPSTSDMSSPHPKVSTSTPKSSSTKKLYVCTSFYSTFTFSTTSTTESSYVRTGININLLITYSAYCLSLLTNPHTPKYYYKISF